MISLGNILAPMTPRRCDDHGCGYYLADRKTVDGRSYKHRGVDYQASVGQQVFAPISGKVEKIDIAYSDDDRFNTLHILSDDKTVLVKLLYVKSNMQQGDVVTRGLPVGTVQNLQEKYSGITNHVHVEVFLNNNRLDPTDLFGRADTSNITSELSVDFSESKADQNLIQYTYSGDDGILVDDLITLDDFSNVLVNKVEFLKIKFEGKTNHRRIYENLTTKQKRSYNEDGSDEYNENADYTVNSGTQVFIPLIILSIENEYESNITVEKTRYNEYFPPLLREVTNDPGFIPAHQNKGQDGKVLYPHITIKIWSRAKYLESGNGIIDVTNDIIRCSTNADIRSGGDFNIELSAIVGKMIVSESGYRWEKQGQLNDEFSTGHSVKGRSFVDQDGGNRNEFINNHFYYEKVLDKNDLVFISFERLKIDGPTSDQVHGHWYDMIGLIDVTQISSNGQNNDVAINVRGRDLVKVLQDDNSYFNPYSVGHVNSLYGGQLGERFLHGEFKTTAAFLARSIRESIEFIFHRIVSIGYVPDEIFSMFVNKTHYINYKSVGANTVVNAGVKGIWQIIKVFVDDSIKDLRLVDDSVSNPQGSILDLINKIAQEPFIEFFCDTYGDKFYLMFRKPPFTEEAVKKVVDGIDGGELPGVSFDGTNANIYKSKDKEDEVDQRRNTEEQDGVPMVLTQTNKSRQVRHEYPPIINISAEDVISESLAMSNESYAWYKINDRGNFAGLTVNLGHIPALYFDEVAQVFGNKMLEVTSNYSDYKFFQDEKTETEKDLYAEQASQHLAFIVETNMYLPFTRKGSITLNGDRRIKKGNWIYFRPTREIFYVTNVFNSININQSVIDRTTTIQVERGMVIDFIKPTPQQIIDRNGLQKTIQASYFNIINIPRLQKGVYDTITGGSADEKFDHKSNMSIDVDVFNFFLQGRQFKHKYER